MLANCPSAGAVPDVNKSGQGMCFCNCYSLCELHKKETHSIQGFAVRPTVLSLKTEKMF